MQSFLWGLSFYGQALLMKSRPTKICVKQKWVHSTENIAHRIMSMQTLQAILPSISTPRHCALIFWLSSETKRNTVAVFGELFCH